MVDSVEVFKKPIGSAVRKRVRPQVLIEETYVEEMGKIIERDFFPDLEKVKVQIQYLDAEKGNDSEEMRRLHLKYAAKKDLINGSFDFFVPELDKSSCKKLTLDQYLTKYTSEDNESFEEIIEEAKKKHDEKYAYLAIEAAKLNERFETRLSLPSIEQQCAIADRPRNVDTWRYTSQNSLMFVPDGVENTTMQLEKQRAIDYNNTRLRQNPFKEAISDVTKNQIKNQIGRVDVDGNVVNTSETPKVAGFGFVRTPSPNPDVDSTPLMTWGEIEGTPFRLDASDTPMINRTNTPSFHIKDVSQREQIAYDLAEKVGEKNRNQKKRALNAVRQRIAAASPSPYRISRLEKLNSMSPAAKKLVNLSGVTTPKFYTVKPRPSPSPNPRLNLTDNLLQINSSDVMKRKSASEFF